MTLIYHKLNAWGLLFLSMILSASSTSAVMLWFSLEVNFICFIYLMQYYYSSPNIFSTYLLVQSFSGVWILICVLTSSLVNLSSVILVMILIKLGSAPFHYWYFYLLKVMNWEMIWALSTLQKFIPLMFLIITNTPSKPLVLLSLTNLLVSVSTSYTNNDMKWILGSSTLFTLGWVLPLLNITPELSLLYYFLYACMLANFVWVAMTSHPAKGTFNFNSKNYTMSCMYLLGLTLFMMGMPPFLGFLGKISLLSVIAKFSGGLAFCLMFISVYLMYMYISVISQLMTLLSLQKANLGSLDSKMSVKGLSASLLVLSLLLSFSSVLF